MRRYILLKITLFFALLLLLSLHGFSQTFSLPTPTGNYSVGTTNFTLKDVYREETFTEEKYDFREFTVRAWYPADDVSGNVTLKYLAGYNADTLKYFWNMFDIPEKLFDLIGEVNTNSYVNATVSGNRSSYPVIIFSHGYGLGIPELYTFMAEELASNGFIVLSLTHPYESVEIETGGKSIYLSEERANQMLQENLMEYAVMKNASTDEERIEATKSVLENSPIAQESLKEWVKDAEFLLNQLDSPSGMIPLFLLDKMDKQNIGALGHSFGGAMSGQLALYDSRIKAVMNMDGFQYGDLLGKDLNFSYAMIYSDANKLMNDAILKSGSGDLYTIIIPKTYHFAFTDMIAYPPVFDKGSFTGDVNQITFIPLMDELMVNYFNKYLYNENVEFPSEEIMSKYIGNIDLIRK
ncbi:MAG: hypothetical protein KDC73_12805 [Ignavibacteriae bacterium]|nr:hypothetical protein [Ignavibacteriota bacterium]MCB9242857.1 hypothetical protein [Ignavibacteriales bacterium]